MRRPRHRFHSACHHDVELASPDQLGGKRDGIQAGQADLVDPERGNRHRDASGDGCLTRWDLTLARLQYLAHDHVLDSLAGHARTLQRRLDGQPAQLSSAEPAQRAEQATNRGTSPANDYCFAHS